MEINIMRYSFFILLFFLISNTCVSQVIASDDVVLCDGQQGEVGVTLTATSFAVDLTDSNIYTDDIFGGVIDMGFDFEFYGNTYNQVVLSSNNYLSFNTANAGGYSAWPINAAIPNNFDAPMNAILCPWQDIYPGVNGNGTIQYATTGEAPNRVFIASFCGIPMFSCTEVCYSSQIKLFEGTNIIETHIAQKVLCTTWNDGAAIHGLHNENGTIAHVVTGLDGIERNYPNQWTCENDGWQFEPNGDNDYIITNIEFAPAVAGTDIIWQDEFGNQIGTGGEITVFPGGDVTYTAGASLCGSAGDWCGFDGGIEGDDVNITFEELPISGDVIGEISCFEANDGAVTITAPDEGEWIYNLYLDDVLYGSQESSNDEEVFTGLQPGSYSATVTEINSGCMSEEWNFDMEEPEELTSPYSVQDVTCYNSDDGVISIELNGGTPTYNTVLGYESGEIINEQSGDNVSFANLEAGEYYFTIIDANGCLVAGDEVFFSISEPNEIIVSETHYSVLCNGADNGSIDLTVNNCPGCEFSWTNEEEDIISTEEDINNLSGGIYSAIVYDENGCNKSVSVEITEPEAMSILETHSDYNDYGVSCFGGNDGSIDIAVNGGTGNYTYIWSNGEASESISNLLTGLYSVDVIDENGCNISISVDITEPSEILLYESHSNENDEDFCNGALDGWIDLNVTGGVENYNYTWSDGSDFESNQEDIENLSSGTYTIEVDDDNGCTKSLTIDVFENEELILNSSVSECVDNNGNIDITVNGCSGNCEYDWSNGATTEDVEDLSVGEYSTLITDVFGCQIYQEFTINANPIADFNLEEDQFYLSDTPTIFTDLSNDTNIDVWNWNFGDDNTMTFYTNENPSHLYTEPGTYYVTLSVIDTDGCSDEIIKKIEVLQEYYSYTPSIFTPNNDGLNDTFQPSLFNIDKNSYQLVVFDRWGQVVFETIDYDQGWNGQLKNGAFLPSDVYSYKIQYNTKFGDEKEEKGKLIMAK